MSEKDIKNAVKMELFHQMQHEQYVQQAQLQVTDFLETEGLDPTLVINSGLFDYEDLAWLFENRKDGNRADNDVWREIFIAALSKTGMPEDRRPLHTYQVRMYVDGLFNTTITAHDKEEAAELAVQIFQAADVGDIEVEGYGIDYIKAFLKEEGGTF